MKRFFAVMLTLSLALTLTACGGKDAPAPEEEQVPPAEETVSAVVSVDYADQALSEEAGVFDLWIDDDSEYQVRAAFTTNVAVEDFRYVALDFLEQEGDIQLYVAQELYTKETLTPERPLVVTMALMSTIPDRGIIYRDETGTERTFTVSMSGEDGSLLLTEEPFLPEGSGTPAYEIETRADGDVTIQVPVFSGAGAETLNALVDDRVNAFTTLDPELFPAGTGQTINYQTAVTLLDEHYASMVFFGERMVEGAAYPTQDLVSLNVDLATMEPVELGDLYTVDGAFGETFFAQAQAPEAPYLALEGLSFEELLEMQSPASPFETGAAACYLTPAGPVVVLSAVHATGNDYFEAALSYDAVESFRR